MYFFRAIFSLLSLLVLEPIAGFHHASSSSASSSAAARTSGNSNRKISRPTAFRLSNMAEWRDLEFPADISNHIAADPKRPSSVDVATLMPKSVCVLPFSVQELLLQGQTTQLHLYEERFTKLFDDCIQNHAGIMGMGLVLAEQLGGGIIQTMPLCEVETFTKLQGLGIMVTIRAVGRAKLLGLIQEEPYMRAVCTEMTDTLPDNNSMELSNLVATNIESLMLWLTSMEQRLDKAKQDSSDDDNVEDDDPEMLRRITIAKLEDTFYADNDDGEETAEESDDEEPEASEEDEVQLARLDRFRAAFQVAKTTDTQGYKIASQTMSDRSPQDLTAISWASFCTEVSPTEDVTLRIQALDIDNLFDRLRLALKMLREKKSKVKSRLEKAGLTCRDYEDDASA